MNGHSVRDVAETIILGMEENDKVESAMLLEEATPDERAVISIEMDTGEAFFAEIIPA